MAQVTFGTVLREARERKGYDLSSAARRLRIRPDILRSIEDDDFARMPPRGYTRNMVNAYARLVGLNPTEITRMYLDEAYAYQVGRARSGTKPAGSGFDMGGSSRSKRTARPTRHEETDERPVRQNALGRTLYDDRTAYGNSDYGQQGPSAHNGRLHSESRTHASRHTALPNSQYTNFYAGPKAPGGIQAKLPFIIGGAVILVLLIVLLFLVLGNKGTTTDDVSNMRVTGLTDTTVDENGNSTSGEEPVKPVETAPTSVTVVYEVPSGTEAYAVVTTDGTAESKMLTGPVKETVDVTGAWSIATWVDSVTVTVNGTKVEFDTTDADGIPQCTVDFASYLEKWKQEHPDAAASTTETGTTGSSGTSSTGAGSASTAAA